MYTVLLVLFENDNSQKLNLMTRVYVQYSMEKVVYLSSNA